MREHGNAKLSWDEVHEIRRRCADGETRVSLAKEFAVCKATVDMIVTFTTWTGMPNPQERDPNNTAFNQYYNNYKGSAKRRGLVWGISKQEFRELTQSPCHYCGAAPSDILRYKSGSYVKNGIDRVDNSAGYIEGNYVPCCKWCNWAKRTRTYDEFVEWIRRAYHHMEE